MDFELVRKGINYEKKTLKLIRINKSTGFGQENGKTYELSRLL